MKQNKILTIPIALLGTLIAIVLIVCLVRLIALFYPYIHYLRVPILVIFFLVSLPLISRSPLLRNLFIFRNKWQLALVIPAALIAGLAVANIFETILVDAPTRFDFMSLPQGWQQETWQWIKKIISNEIIKYPLTNKLTIEILTGKDILAFFLGSPICITAINRSKKDSQLSKNLNNNNQTNTNRGSWILPGVLIGLLLAIVFILITNISTSLLTNYVEHSRTNLETQLINLIKLLPQDGAKGYLTEKGGLSGSHLSNLGFLIVVLLFYIFSGIWGCSLLRSHQSRNGQKTEEEFNVPALFYLMLITTGITLFFGGASFLLDYYLIPVLLVFLVLSALIYGLFNVDHYYQLKKLSDRKNPLDLDEKQNTRRF